MPPANLRCWAKRSGRASGAPWASGAGEISAGATDFADNFKALGGLYGHAGFLYAPQYEGGGTIHRVAKVTGATDFLVTIADGPSLHGVDLIDSAFYFTEAKSGSAGDARICDLPGSKP